MTPDQPSSTIHNPSSSEVLRRELHPKASVPPDLTGPVIDFRSSDETLDRYKERITVAGWHLENYRKNPVVQNAHNYCSLSDTIGKSLITEIRHDAPRSTLHAPTPYLFQRVLFAVEENPMAKVAYALYKGGFLTAVSVGFIPIDWENGTKEAGYRRKYLEQELLEVSAVSIPANPNALSLGFDAGAIEMSDLNELFDLLKHFRVGAQNTQHGTRTTPPFCTKTAERIPNTSALGSAIHEARLLHLRKQIQEIRAGRRRRS